MAVMMAAMQPRMSQTSLSRMDAARAESKPPRKPRRHCNQLDGKRWIQNSISVWSDIRKSIEETRLKHPAMFPSMLAERLIETFLPLDGEVVLDPFAGSGSTLIAAETMGKRGIGLELSPEYVSLASERLRGLNGSADNASKTPHNGSPKSSVLQASAFDL